MLENLPFLGNNKNKKKEFVRGVKEASLKSGMMMNDNDKNLKYEAMIILMNDLGMLGSSDVSYDRIRNKLKEQSWSDINLEMVDNFTNKMKSNEFKKSVKEWIFETFPENNSKTYLNAFNALDTKF